MDNDLKDRTREYALRVIWLVAALPKDRTNDVVARQLLRSGTSPGAHFREALRARSKAEYTAKMNGGRTLEGIKKETNELIAIFISSLKNGGADRSKAFLLSAFCFLL
jgi:hypothetical protein